MPGKNISFSIFDPLSGRFINKVIVLPPIIVSGYLKKESIKLDGEVKNITQLDNKKFETDLKRLYPLEGIVAPNFKKESFFRIRIFEIIGLILGVILLVFLYSMIRERLLANSLDREILNLKKDIQENGLEYSSLYRLILHLKNKKVEGEPLAVNVLLESSLSEETKNYFKVALESCKEAKFNEVKRKVDLKYKNQPFEELFSYIKKMKENENLY